MFDDRETESGAAGFSSALGIDAEEALTGQESLCTVYFINKVVQFKPF